MSTIDPYRHNRPGVPQGTRLNGIYEIDAMIGCGGMGEIYKGHEMQTGMAVAIKMLLPDMADNEAALALFRREASALHYLMHDAIVRYFVFTVEPTLHRPYLAMEFVDGRALSDLLDESALTFEAVLRLMRRIASGLGAAHERGIVHRDVSPDNIIIPRADIGRAKIIDFGIARSAHFGDQTIIGDGFAGKQNYVSPEQVGLYGGEVTPKSDVYSLGLVLFHALTGQKLDMGGTQFQLVEKRRKLPDLGAVDMRLRPLLENMLQPDPQMRPSMTEIEHFDVGGGPRPQIDKPVVSPDANVSTHPSTTNGRRPSWTQMAWTASATVLVLLLVAAGYSYYRFVWKGSVVTAAARPPSAILDTRLQLPQETATKQVAKQEQPPPDNAATRLPDSGDRPGIIRLYLENYDGGECVFIQPIAVSSSAAVIEGFGSSLAPFEELDRIFSRNYGFEASIGVRQVTNSQCPAITFLHGLRTERSRAPRLGLASVQLKIDETLAGSVENFTNRVVELLLIGEDGLVHNVSYALRPGTDSLQFAIELRRTSLLASGRAGPHLLMAVTTPQVLESLRQSQAIPADQFFFQAVSEARRSRININASARHFQVSAR